MTNWAKRQAGFIKQEARERYGRGWDVLSDEQRKNYFDSRVLQLVLKQDGPKYKPAQELVQSVFAELNDLPTQELVQGTSIEPGDGLTP